MYDFAAAEGGRGVIYEVFLAQLERLRPYLEEAERKGHGAQITLSAFPSGKVGEPRLQVHVPADLLTKEKPSG